MVVVKWCKCLNVKICLVNPPTPVGDLKWVTEHTSMRKCGESKVQGNVVTMELDKLVQARMVQGWQVWKCFNCCIDVCAIDLNNSVALVNMDMEDNDDVSQLQLDASHVYSDCFRIIVDNAPASEDTPPIAEKDPHSIENFNLLQEFVDEYLADAERVMQKRIRQYVKEQNEIFNQIRGKVNGERTVIWRKMCSVVSNPAPPPASAVLSSTPSTSSTPSAIAAAPISRSRASSVSRPHSRSVSGAVAPFAGANHASTPTPKSNLTPEVNPDSMPVVGAESPQPVTPPKQVREGVTKWQAAPRPGSTEIPKNKIRRPASPSIFSFDDEDHDDFEVDHDSDSSEDEPEDETPTITTTPVQPKIPDSSNLLGTSLPVAIPARTFHPSRAPTTRAPTSQLSTTQPQQQQQQPQKKSPNTGTSVAVRAPTTVSMSAVSMANISSTAPAHQYHAAMKPQTQQPTGPLSTSASGADNPQPMVPKQSWREDYLGEATEESVPVEMASSFVIPLSLNRRLKSLI